MWLSNKDRGQCACICCVPAPWIERHLPFPFLSFSLFLYPFLSPSLSFSIECMLVRIICIEVFAVYNERVCMERFFDSRNHLAVTSYAMAHARLLILAADFSLCVLFIPKRKTVMWLLWIRQMIFDSFSTTNTVHCIPTTKYTCHTRCRDGDNEGNSNSNSSLHRMQVPISKSAYK